MDVDEDMRDIGDLYAEDFLNSTEVNQEMQEAAQSDEESEEE